MTVVYVDTSVVLAHVRAEPSRPAASFWDAPMLVSSVLTEWETWTRLHVHGEAAALGPAADAVLSRLDLVALDRAIGGRCRSPFPVPLGTMDALHLATADSLRARGLDVRVATYDSRMGFAASAMGFALVPHNE